MKKSLSWPKAQQWCREQGHDLASARNAEENDIIKSVLHREDVYCEPQVFPWIGLWHHVSTSWDEPQWSDPTRVRYRLWARNEPSNYPVRRHIIHTIYIVIYIYRYYYCR